MADEDGLILNLSSFNDGEQEVRQRKTNRKLKWKERKVQKREGYLESKVLHNKRNDVIPKKSSQDAPQNKKLPPLFSTKSNDKAEIQAKERNIKDDANVQERRTNSGIKQSQGKVQVISSLFKCNPEIPKLQSPLSNDAQKIEKNKEEKLFSADRFSELKLSEFMVSNLEENLSMTTMTSVQKAAIPPLLEGKDVFVKSKTGTGKTLTYAVPVIHCLQNIKPKIERNDGPFALVLVPTRELAIQSFDVLLKLVKPFSWVVPGIVTGGEKRKAEKARIRKGINVLVATPGRLLDHIEKTRSLELKNLRWIILDEADRLLDLGFERDVSSILTAIQKALFPGVKCQTVLLSATLNEGVKRLAGISLHQPLFIDVTASETGGEVVTNVPFEPQEISQKLPPKNSEESSYSTPQQLKQLFVIVPSKLRLVSLATFLLWKNKESSTAKMIVFLSSRDSVDFHCDLFKKCLVSFSESQLALFKLHGNMSQQERTAVFKHFSDAKTGMLFCTDVAARGLDLPHVNWIVQYNTPGDPADYVHRVGRTARIGLKGNALLFLTPAEVAYLETLKQRGIRLQELLIDDILETLAITPDNRNRQKGKNTIDQRARESATKLQNSFEDYVISDQRHLEAAKAAYQSFVRAYATYPSSLKDIFHVKNLHLGHVAKSFALREAPKDMFQYLKQENIKKRKRDGEIKKISFKKVKIEEFSSDLSLQGPLTKKETKKLKLKQKKKNRM